MLVPTSGKYRISGTAIPDPSKATVSINPLQGKATGRTDDGTFHSELISPGKRKVELSYDAIPHEQLSAICRLLMVQYYTFSYPNDPVDGAKTIECYGTPISQDLYSGVFYGGLWRNVKFSCIER